jgi:hypothetical protein
MPCDDPILTRLPPPGTVFHCHSDTFDLPAGAELLARFEATPEMIVDWCVEDRNCGDMRELSAPPDPRFNRTRLNDLAVLVFGQWRDPLPWRPGLERRLRARDAHRPA